MPFSTLVDTDTLARHLDDPSWVVFDCRHDLARPDWGAAEYAQSHIPGARFLHLDRDLSAPMTGRNGRHPLPDAKLSYAIGRTACAGAEPNPSNHLLYSTRQSDWPYPDYRSKRFEVYYTLAGGTKGIGYWWLVGANGMNNTDPDSKLLWKEIGLCGNEIKTARNLIVRSTPVDGLSLTPSANVWARGVASGIDSLILYVVNDNYTNDINGCHVTSVPNATVTVTLHVVDAMADGLRGHAGRVEGREHAGH